MTDHDWADASQLSVADPAYLDQLDPPVTKPKARRGTTNKNVSGNAEDRRRRRKWLLETYRADVDINPLEPDNPKGIPPGLGIPACRCYRCGKLLTLETLTVDRIIPGALGGTYRQNNIRPACGGCNEKTGGATRRVSKHRCVDCQREDPEDARRPRKIVEWSGAERCATHLRKATNRAKSKTTR